MALSKILKYSHAVGYRSDSETTGTNSDAYSVGVDVNLVHTSFSSTGTDFVTVLTVGEVTTLIEQLRDACKSAIDYQDVLDRQRALRDQDILGDQVNAFLGDSLWKEHVKVCTSCQVWQSNNHI